MYRRTPLALALAAALVAGPALAAAQPRAALPDPCTPAAQPCITVAFEDAEIREVLAAFAQFSGRSIVVGRDVEGTVTAAIRRQPWDVALKAILEVNGMTAVEDASGILRVQVLGSALAREAEAPLVTRVFRLSYTPVAEVAATLEPLVSERGSISTSPTTNTLIVTDTAESLARIAPLLGGE